MKSPKFSGKLKKLKVFVIRRVVGDSMTPTLLPGKIVVGTSLFSKIKPGNIVIVVHDGKEKIKRVDRKTAGKLFIVGDNTSASTDSRDFGWVSVDSVVARVFWPN